MGIYLGPFRITKRGVRVRVGPRIARLHVGAGRPGISTGAGPFTMYKSLGRGRRSGGDSPLSGGDRARAAVLAGIVVLVVIGAMIALFGGGSGTPAGKSLAAATKGASSAVTTATPAATPDAAVTPAATHSAAPAAAANPQQPATGPGGCHPLSNEGTCYEPGEFCRTSDHGVTGLAGDGETIVCKNVDGWRWEPVSAPPPAGSSAPSTKPSPAPTTPSPTPTPAPSPTP